MSSISAVATIGAHAAGGLAGMHVAAAAVSEMEDDGGPFMEYATRYELEGIEFDVVTEWWRGRPADPDAIEHIERPGIWLTQRLIRLS